MTNLEEAASYPWHRTDWAWEFLRRNEEFRAMASRSLRPVPKFVEDGLTMFKQTAPAPRAEAWGLASFPGSRSDWD